MKRTKIINLFTILVLTASIFYGCSSSNDSSTKSEIGNSSGNIINGGIATKQGEWVYFTSGSAIYKEKVDGSERTLVINDNASNINVVNDWIYYKANINNVTKMFKVKTDGTERTKLSDDIAFNMIVSGDWIYFLSSGLYKMKTDGTEKTQISKDSAMFLNVVGDWIYYSNGTDGFKIYKVKTDGTERTKLSDESAIGMNVSGDWIYYVNYKDENKIYKLKIDGTGKAKLSDDSAPVLNVFDGWIYYWNNNENNNLFKLKLDGTERVKLNDDYSDSPNIVGEWIYYNNYSKDRYYYNYDNDLAMVYKIKTDGTGRSVTVSGAENFKDQTLTLSTLAENSNALIGEFDKIYIYNSEVGTASIKISSITTQKEFQWETNLVVIEYDGNIDIYPLEFAFFDKDGKWFQFLVNTTNSAWPSIGGKTAMYFSGYFPDEPPHNLADFTKYIMISGLDADKNNGKTRVVFELVK